MATPEPDWHRCSSPSHSPDTLSPLWPDRPIRPMPKNRLRSKLSPEQADQIVFPPNPPTSSPLFSFPYGLADATSARRVNGHRHTSPAHCTCGAEHDGSEEEEEEEEDDDGAFDHPSYRWASTAVDGSRLDNVQRKLLEASRGPLKAPPPPASITSSADGYESFENTSNKKKRKIPLSSSSSVHQSQLSAELASMGLNGLDGASDQVDGDSHQSRGEGTVNTGISGSGRGRFSRQSHRNERRPLGPTTYAMAHGYSSSLSARSRGGNWRGDGTKTNQNGDQGIISAAIANAAEQQPATPPKGKENISLLSQQSPQSTTPKTQFTFTCESDSSNKMVWPGQDGAQYGHPSSSPQVSSQAAIRPHPPQTAARGQPTQMAQGTQTAPPARGGGQYYTNPAAPPPAPATNAPPAANGVPPEPRPRRRRPSREFAIAARNRKMRQEITNYHHKPTKDSMWICEFCEYEDIYGEPPFALIRQYEIKDRAERKKAEERRRLLEKAKMKKGKGKKGGKGGKNGGAQNVPPPPNNQPYDPALDNVPLPPDAEGDEYYDDEYDDGYEDPGHVDPRVPGGFHDYGPSPYGDQRHAHAGAPPPASSAPAA